MDLRGELKSEHKVCVLSFQSLGPVTHGARKTLLTLSFFFLKSGPGIQVLGSEFSFVGPD